MKRPPLLDRLRAKKMLRGGLRSNVGCCWYTEDNWRLVKESAVDPDRFENTYSEWCAMAENAVVDIAKTGIIMAKVMVDVSELKDWLSKNGKENSAEARAEYAQVKMSRGEA